jgi:hypothetical protein
LTPQITYNINQVITKSSAGILISITIGEARAYLHRVEIDVDFPVLGKRTAKVQPSEDYQDALCFDTNTFVASLKSCFQTKTAGGKIAGKLHFTGGRYSWET